MSINGVNPKVKRLLDEVESIPPISSEIHEICDVIDNPDSTIPEIAKKISKDPGLSADILKMANSAFYNRMFGQSVTALDDAVKRIGLKALKYFILYTGITNVMGQKYAPLDEVIKHCTSVADIGFFFSYWAKMRALSDEIYVAGLLHDIGKLVMIYFQKDLFELIEKAAKQATLGRSEIERKLIGITHGELGYYIAEKWNFPELISNVIKYHHFPLEDENEGHLKINTIIYLSDLLYYYMFDMKLTPAESEQLIKHIGPFILALESKKRRRPIENLDEIKKHVERNHATSIMNKFLNMYNNFQP